MVLRVSHCGVCGSDLHLVMEGWGRPDSIGGHEYAGRIAALGSAVKGWELGAPVVGGPTAGCGRCEYCATHRPSLCASHGTPGVSDFQGAFAEFVRVHESQLRRIPAGLSMREAALAEPLAVALHGVTLSQIAPGRRALVTGAGPIGMLTLAALRAKGIDDVTVSEPSATRRAAAVRVGASQVVTPDELPRPRMPFEFVRAGVRRRLRVLGQSRGGRVRAAPAQAGRHADAGRHRDGRSRKLDANRMILGELRVIGSYNYDEHGIDDALALLAGGKLPTGLLLEPGDVGLEGLASAMERLAAGEIGGKLLVAPN